MSGTYPAWLHPRLHLKKQGGSALSGTKRVLNVYFDTNYGSWPVSRKFDMALGHNIDSATLVSKSTLRLREQVL